MAVSTRTRNDPRREATRTALIEAAESLIAEAGVDGVSTRQIGAAAGSSNTNVVAYHFGGKDELIRAVYRYRLPDIDRRRGELLDEADAQGKGHDLQTLVRTFYQPLFEQTDAEGRHSYARFISALERSGMIATRAEVRAEFPETDRVSTRMCETLSAGILPLFNHRQRLVAGLISSALLQIDREALDDPDEATRLFDNAVSMAASAMSAPLPDSHKRNSPHGR